MGLWVPVALTPTAVQTSNYTATAGQLVRVDTTSGNVTVTLPTAPANGTQVGAKQVVRGSTNTVSVAAGGSDVFNVASGSTTQTITLLNQGATFQYVSSGAIWIEVSDDNTLAQLDSRYANQATLTTKGDTYVATGSATLVRQAVGATNNDPWVTDSAQTNGVRYDAGRGSDLYWLRDAQGLLCGNTPGVTVGSGGGDSVVMTSSTRTLHLLLGKLPNSTSIGHIVCWTSQAMSGGTATIALYGSTSLTSNSWSRLGSNVTCTTTLQAAAGRQSITYSTSTTADQWIRAELVLSSTAPTTYPGFYAGVLPIVALVNGGAAGNFVNSYSSGTTVPGSTLDPTTGWTDAALVALVPAMALTA